MAIYFLNFFRRSSWDVTGTKFKAADEINALDFSKFKA